MTCVCVCICMCVYVCTYLWEDMMLAGDAEGGAPCLAIYVGVCLWECRERGRVSVCGCDADVYIVKDMGRGTKAHRDRLT